MPTLWSWPTPHSSTLLTHQYVMARIEMGIIRHWWLLKSRVAYYWITLLRPMPSWDPLPELICTLISLQSVITRKWSRRWRRCSAICWRRSGLDKLMTILARLLTLSMRCRRGLDSVFRPVTGEDGAANLDGDNSSYSLERTTNTYGPTRALNTSSTANPTEWRELIGKGCVADDAVSLYHDLRLIEAYLQILYKVSFCSFIPNRVHLTILTTLLINKTSNWRLKSISSRHQVNSPDWLWLIYIQVLLSPDPSYCRCPWWLQDGNDWRHYRTISWMRVEGTSAVHDRVLILCGANALDLWIARLFRLFSVAYINDYKAMQPWRRCSDHARVAIECLGTGVVAEIRSYRDWNLWKDEEPSMGLISQIWSVARRSFDLVSFRLQFIGEFNLFKSLCGLLKGVYRQSMAENSKGLHWIVLLCDEDSTVQRPEGDAVKLRGQTQLNIHWQVWSYQHRPNEQEQDCSLKLF